MNKLKFNRKSAFPGYRRIYRQAKGNNHGAVLVVVVILLALVTVILTRLAIVSLGQARDVALKERMMQEKWAVTSLRLGFLTAAESVVWHGSEEADQADSEFRMPHSCTFRISLGGSQWDVRVSDESAKLPLHRLALVRPMVDVQQAMDSFGSFTVSASLRDTVLASDGGELALIPSRFESWFSIVDGNRPGIQYSEINHFVTLWGDGRVNLRSARPEVVEAVWRSLFGRPAPKEILEFGTGEEPSSLPQILAGLNLRENDRKMVHAFFGTESQARSVWIQRVDDRLGLAKNSELFFSVTWGERARSRNRLGIYY